MAVVPLTEVGYVNPNSGTTGTRWAGWTRDLEDEPVLELTWPNSVQVYGRMRRDAQIASVLRAVTYPVMYTSWRIAQAGASDEVTELIADDFGLPVVGAEPSTARRARDRFSWADHLRHALLELPYGHSFMEQLYRYDETTRRHRLRKLSPRLPRTIAAVNVARDGGLESIEQQPAGGVRDRQRPIPVSRLVAYVYDREGGNWLGQSLLRPAYPHWQFKRRLMPVQAGTIERNGMGVPRYTGPDFGGDDALAQADLEKGLRLATSWRSGEAAGAAVPYGAQLDLVGVSGELPDAMPAIRYHDEQIARAVLAHFLNLGSQHGGQVGSYALGSTFAEFFVASLQAIAQHIADVTTSHVIEDLVDANWGPDEPAPRIVFDEIGAKQAATAAALKALHDAGILLPDRGLEEAVRQQHGLPPKDTPTAPAPQEDP